MTEKLNQEKLRSISGGCDEGGSWRNVQASVASGFLALRSYPSYDDANIIAEIQNGEYFSATRLASKTSSKVAV